MMRRTTCWLRRATSRVRLLPWIPTGPRLRQLCAWRPLLAFQTLHPSHTRVDLGTAAWPLRSWDPTWWLLSCNPWVARIMQNHSGWLLQNKLGSFWNEILLQHQILPQVFGQYPRSFHYNLPVSCLPLPKATWIESKSQSLLDDWEEPTSLFQMEYAKIKYNGQVAFDQFIKNEKWDNNFSPKILDVDCQSRPLMHRPCIDWESISS